MKTRMLDNSVSGVQLGGLAARDHGGLKGSYKLSMKRTPKRYINKAPIEEGCQTYVSIAGEAL